jgi:hypothetical protein
MAAVLALQLVFVAQSGASWAARDQGSRVTRGAKKLLERGRSVLMNRFGGGRTIFLQDVSGSTHHRKMMGYAVAIELEGAKPGFLHPITVVPFNRKAQAPIQITSRRQAKAFVKDRLREIQQQGGGGRDVLGALHEAVGLAYGAKDARITVITTGDHGPLNSDVLRAFEGASPKRSIGIAEVSY